MPRFELHAFYCLFGHFLTFFYLHCITWSFGFISYWIKIKFGEFYCLFGQSFWWNHPMVALTNFILHWCRCETYFVHLLFYDFLLQLFSILWDIHFYSSWLVDFMQMKEVNHHALFIELIEKTNYSVFLLLINEAGSYSPLICKLVTLKIL